MFAGDPEAEERIKRLAWALNGLSVVQGEMGHVEEAKDNLEESISLTEKIDDRDPADSNIARLIMTMKQRLAILDTASGNNEQALQISGELYEQWQRNFDDAAEEDLGVNEGYVSYLTDRAWIAMSVGNTGMAAQSLADAMTRAVDSLKKFPGNRGVGNSLMLAAFRYWEINQALPGESILMNLPYYYSNSGQILACTDASMAARKAIMLGDMDRAKDLTEYLTSNGYAETTFMRACKAHAFCNGQ
jgi:hypothetical protein